MKRILMITTTPFYQEKGSSLRVFAMAKMLGSQYQVDLVAYSLGQDVTIPNVTVHRTPLFFRPEVGVSKIRFSKVLLDLFVLLKCLRLIARNQYDIVHAEDFEAAFIARCLLLFNRKKHFVYDMHNRILDNLTIKGNPSRLFRLAISWCESFVVNRTNLVILNWNKYSSDKIFRNKKTVLYYDQIDVDSIETYQLPFEGNYLVYAGNFEPYQGLKGFIEVFSKCDVDYKLVLIGTPSKEIIDFVKQNNLAERVILTGRLAIPQTNYLIKNSLAGILPRVSGNQPSMKMIHYFLLGRPIIATIAESSAELVQDGKNGYTYSDEKGLVDILSALNKDSHDFKNALTEMKGSLKSLASPDAFLNKYYAE